MRHQTVIGGQLRDVAKSGHGEREDGGENNTSSIVMRESLPEHVRVDVYSKLGTTYTSFMNTSRETQKQIIGECLYPEIKDMAPELAGKITGMLLEMNTDDLFKLVIDKTLLGYKVTEAKHVYAEYLRGRGEYSVWLEQLSEDDKPPKDLSLNEEESPDPRSTEDHDWFSTHKILNLLEDDPFVVNAFLGSGSLGVVEEVKIKERPQRVFVRKRVQLPNYLVRERVRIVQEEANILKDLSHPHIVSLLGTYEDSIRPTRRSYCLLMHPVGDNDLRSFLEIVGQEDPVSPLRGQWHSWIRNWFGCLTSALVYLHSKGVRHQDIKPSNIIHTGDKIYFTDFSSSARFGTGSTTSTDNPARCSAMYGAPEVVDKFLSDGTLRRHGCGSDIFSLGCVFCEMLAVVDGKSVPNFHDYLLDSIREYPRTADHSNPVNLKSGRARVQFLQKVDEITISVADGYIREYDGKALWRDLCFNHEIADSLWESIATQSGGMLIPKVDFFQIIQLGKRLRSDQLSRTGQDIFGRIEKSQTSGDQYPAGILFSQHLVAVRIWFQHTPFFIRVISGMLSEDRTQRPQASDVLSNILNSDFSPLPRMCDCMEL